MFSLLYVVKKKVTLKIKSVYYHLASVEIVSDRITCLGYTNVKG
jgi:hypothetical protein